MMTERPRLFASSADNGVNFNHRTVMKFLRFALMGGCSGLIYAVVTWLLVSSNLADAPIASVIGYLAAVPLNFIGQKIFAFRAGGQVGSQALRFVMTTAVNIALSFGIMLASVSWLQLGTLGGIVLTILSIPFVTFFVLDRWVFAAASREAQRPQ